MILMGNNFELIFHFPFSVFVFLFFFYYYNEQFCCSVFASISLCCCRVWMTVYLIRMKTIKTIFSCYKFQRGVLVGWIIVAHRAPQSTTQYSHLISSNVSLFDVNFFCFFFHHFNVFVCFYFEFMFFTQL